MEFFVVDFEESALDEEFSLVFPIIYFLEDQFDHSGNNPKIFVFQSNCVAAAHGVGLATPSLAVSQDCSVVTLEASQDQILHANLEETSCWRVPISKTLSKVKARSFPITI